MELIILEDSPPKVTFFDLDEVRLVLGNGFSTESALIPGVDQARSFELFRPELKFPLAGLGGGGAGVEG